MCILMPAKHDAEQNKLLFVALHVNKMASEWSLASESCYKVQTFCPQSEGLATRDYLYSSRMCFIIVILRVCRGIGGITVVQSSFPMMVL